MRDKVSQEQIDSVLLLCVCVGVGVKAPAMNTMHYQVKSDGHSILTAHNTAEESFSLPAQQDSNTTTAVSHLLLGGCC
jgi:hypothetical protein